MPTDVVVALGANLNGRRANLGFGLEELEARCIRIERISSIYESSPVCYRQQPPFLNLVVLGKSERNPRELLACFKTIEEASGRKPSFPNAPRTLDIDLIFFGSAILRHPTLRIPHPRWKERSFVVHPVREVAPKWRDPETGLLVTEVAERWPLEPADISVVEDADTFFHGRKRTGVPAPASDNEEST